MSTATQRTRGRPSALVAVGLVLLFAMFGCGDGPAGPGGGDASLMAFEYAGDLEGSFEVRGTTDFASGGARFGTWVTAFRAVDGELVVLAFQGREDPRGDALVMTLENVTGPGTYSFGVGGCNGGDGDCAVAVFGRDVEVDVTDDLESARSDQTYFIVGGTVTIDRLDSRLSGTFHGSGIRADYQASGATLRIEDGRFDTPLQGGGG